MKIVITGANGLIGWHLSCAIKTKSLESKNDSKINLVRLGRAEFEMILR